MKLNINKLIVVALIILFVLVSLIFLKQEKQAVATELISQVRRTRVDLPPVPPNPSPIGRRFGHGSSGDCRVGDSAIRGTHLVALVPEQVEEGRAYVWGKTTSSQSTLWFYVAYLNNPYGEFVLQDDQGNEIYSSPSLFRLEGTPGIIGIQLPNSVESELSNGRLHHWYFKIKCNPRGSSDDYVEGWIQKVSLGSQTNNQSVEYYAENGIWYDALTRAATVQSSCQQGIITSQAWNDLLTQINLSALVRERVFQCHRLQ